MCVFNISDVHTPFYLNMLLHLYTLTSSFYISLQILFSISLWKFKFASFCWQIFCIKRMKWYHKVWQIVLVPQKYQQKNFGNKFTFFLLLLVKLLLFILFALFFILSFCFSSLFVFLKLLFSKYHDIGNCLSCSF